MKFSPEKILRDRALKVTEFGCVTTPGFRSARVRGSGRGVRFRFRRQLSLPVGVAVYRVSRGSRADQARARGALLQDPVLPLERPREAQAACSATAGTSPGCARVRPRARPWTRSTALRVRRGRVSTRGPRFHRADSCGLVEALRLGSPVFRGSRRRPLGVVLRAAARRA